MIPKLGQSEEADKDKNQLAMDTQNHILILVFTWYKRSLYPNYYKDKPFV